MRRRSSDEVHETQRELLSVAKAQQNPSKNLETHRKTRLKVLKESENM